MPEMLKPLINFTQSNDPNVTAYAKLIMPDGKFSNFAVDREMAKGIITELSYHLNRRKPSDLPPPSRP